MRFPPESKEDLAELMDSSEVDNLAALYTLHIGRLFSSIGLLEQATVSLLSIIASHTGADTWLEEHKKLRKSTFGQLVSRLENHGVTGRSLRYLKAINLLRNDVVHNFFWSFPFPGDPQVDSIWLSGAIKHLERMHLHFRFAEVRLSEILVRAGCLKVEAKGNDFQLLRPTGSWLLNESEEMKQ